MPDATRALLGLRKNPIVDLLLTVVAAIVIAYGVQKWVVKPYKIPSQSMERTLHRHASSA